MANDPKRPVNNNRPQNAPQAKGAQLQSGAAARKAPAANAQSAANAGKAGKTAKKSLSTTQVFLIALAGTLLAVGGLWTLVLTREGDLAAERAAAMLRSFEPSGLEPLSESDYQMGAFIDELPSALAPYVAPERPQYETETEIERAMRTLGDFKAIAKLSIPKLDLTLPILSECTTQSLKISVCKFQGPEPLQPGNLVVTGHDYKNGAHFGRLDELSIDDEIIVSDANGDFRRYFVYETLIVAPDDLPALDTGTNANAVTLVTCAEDGDMRLLVKCRAI